MFTDVTIAIRCRRQHTNRSAACSVAFTAATAFHDLRPFEFGDHTLHLKQQIFFGTDTNRAVQEDDFHTAFLQLFNDQHLPGVLASQAIRRVDI